MAERPSEFRAAEQLLAAIEMLWLARSPESVAGIVCRTARQLMRAEGAALILKEDQVCHHVEEDAIAPLFKGRRFPDTACIGGWALRQGETVVIEDIHSDERTPTEVYRSTFVRGLVSVPIREPAPTGAIAVYWAAAHRAGDEELRVLQVLAKVTGAALAHLAEVAELEARGARQTAELKVKNRELDRFIHSAAHDLKSPIRSIEGFSTMFLAQHASALEPEAREFVEAIHRSATQMLRLLEDLVAYARAGGEPRQPCVVDLPVLVRAVLGEHAPALRSRGAEISFDFQVAQVCVDTDGLGVALGNVIDNAIKYTPLERAPQLHICSRQAADGRVSLSVHDEGIGFDMKHHDRIFEIFQRLHGKSEFPGTGVGLAIVRRVMERMGGTARAESVPGRGATFYLEFQAPADSPGPSP